MMMCHSKLTEYDLEALADEATRQNLSLACLIGAMQDGSPIAWMDKEDHRLKYRIVYANGRWNVIEPSGEVAYHFKTWQEAIAHVRVAKGQVKP